MGTKKGQRRKTARRAYEPKKKKGLTRLPRHSVYRMSRTFFRESRTRSFYEAYIKRRVK